MQIIVPKQILLMSHYFGENLHNWPSIVHFYLSKLCVCTIFSASHQEGEQIIFMDIRVLLNANNRTETNFANEPLLWRKSAQLAVYCTFLFKEIVHLHHIIGKFAREEHIIFMDIREPLNANNRTETDFPDEPLFWRKSAQLAVYCTFLF